MKTSKRKAEESKQEDGGELKKEKKQKKDKSRDEKHKATKGKIKHKH